MKKNVLISLITAAMLLALVGCGPSKPSTTGYLSDYSKLVAYSDVSFRYVAPNKTIGNYSKFIINQVEVFYHTNVKEKNKAREEDLTTLKNYMYEAIVDALEDGYEIVDRPGPDVVRLRVAITDLKKSTRILNILPQTRLIGSGRGGASLEVELVDSQTGEQLGAVVESQLGNRFSLAGVTTWGDTKAVMNRWAKRLRLRIDEEHGRM